VKPNAVRTFLSILTPCVWLSILHVELRIDLSSADAHGDRPMEPATLFLTITASTNASSSLTVSTNTPHITTANPANPAVEGAVHPTSRTNSETTQPTTVIASFLPSSQMGDVPTSVQPMADNHMEMPRIALRQAEETLNTMETWTVAVDVIKRVMDVVSPIAAVCLASFCLPFSELTSVC
jgi:hypothetical protein